jgi:hypothetical protein
MSKSLYTITVSSLPLLKSHNRNGFPRPRRYTCDTTPLPIGRLQSDSTDIQSRKVTIEQFISTTKIPNQNARFYVYNLDTDVQEDAGVNNRGNFTDLFTGLSQIQPPHLDPSSTPELRRNVELSHDRRNMINFENSAISYEDFVAMSKVGGAGWFSDNAMSVTLQLLEEITACGQHSIAVAQYLQAQNCYTIGTRAIENIDMRSYDHLIEKLRGKRFIILPVCDGYQQVQRQRDATHFITEGGLHWSLIVADVSGDVIKGMHFDPYSYTHSMNQSTANRV